MLEQLVDRYIRYAGSHTVYLRNYIRTYGKPAVYYIQSKDNDTSEIYANAFGSDNVGFALNSDKYQKVDVHVIIDMDNFQKVEIAQDSTVMMLIDTAIKVTPGDRIQFNTRGMMLVYDIISPIESYQDLAYRLNLRLVTRKSID